MTIFRPYPLAAILIAVIVITGFWPSYFGLILSGDLDVAPLVHVHNAVFLGWIALLFLQASLVAGGRTDLHKKTGVWGIFLGSLVVVVGVTVVMNRVARGIAEGHLEKAQQFMLIPLTDMLLFAGFFIAAVTYRKRPKIHKCLMLLATVALLDAPVSRIAFLGDPAPPAVFMLVWFSPIILLIAADLVKNRKIPWLYVMGLAVLVLSGVRMPLSQTEAWLSIARVLTGSG